MRWRCRLFMQACSSLDFGRQVRFRPHGLRAGEFHLFHRISEQARQSPANCSSSVSKSSSLAYSMMTLPRPLWSSMRTLRPRARWSCSWTSRTLGSMGGLGFGFLFGGLFGVKEALDVVLGLANRKRKSDNALGRLFHLFGVFEGQQGTSMTETELAGFDAGLDGGGKRRRRKKLATVARSLPVRAPSAPGSCGIRGRGVRRLGPAPWG